MSEKETIRAALQILTIQLTQNTFDGGDFVKSPLIDHVSNKSLQIGSFIADFEAILESIKSLTHGTFPSSVKKTMLQAQLRGEAAKWRWESDGESLQEMDYEQFKGALRKHWGSY